VEIIDVCFSCNQALSGCVHELFDAGIKSFQAPPPAGIFYWGF